MRQENQDLRKSLDDARDERESVRIQNATLESQLDSERNNRHLRNFAITVGSALAGAGAFPSLINAEAHSWWLVVVGTLLLIVSWVSPIKLESGASEGRK